MDRIDIPGGRVSAATEIIPRPPRMQEALRRVRAQAPATPAPAPAGAQHDPCPNCQLPHNPNNGCPQPPAPSASGNGTGSNDGGSNGNGGGGNGPAPGTLGAQRAAIRALAHLADRFPNLPDLHATLPRAAAGGGIRLQASGLADFETWREALRIAPATVTWHEAPNTAWLSAGTTVAGVHVELTGHADRPTSQTGAAS